MSDEHSVPSLRSPQDSSEPPSDRTRIIRRHPTGAVPVVEDDPATSLVAPDAEDPQTSYIRRATPVTIPPSVPRAPSPKSAVAAAVASILTGWGTAIIATDLIAGWWRTDPLFCVAIGFLTAIATGGTVAGLILLLLRRSTGRWLILVGSVVALMIFASLFVAGAKLAPIVYAIPAFPMTSIVLALLPATKRWGRGG